MSNSFTYDLETKLLGHCFGGAAYAQPASEYVALYTTAPSYGGGGAEVSGTAYSRQAVAWTTATGTPPYVENTGALQWSAAGSPWGTITSVAIHDALTAGNMLASAIIVDPADGVTPLPRVINTGDIMRISVAGLWVGFQNPVPATSGMSASLRLRATIERIRAQR